MLEYVSVSENEQQRYAWVSTVSYTRHKACISSRKARKLNRSERTGSLVEEPETAERHAGANRQNGEYHQNSNPAQDVQINVAQMPVYSSPGKRICLVPLMSMIVREAIFLSYT